MRILVLQEDVPPIAKGGAGVVVARLAKEFSRQGHEVCVLAAVPEKNQAGSYVEEGLRVERFYSNYHVRFRGWRCLYNPRGVRAVKKVLAEFRPEVVHAHNVHQNISYYSLVLAKKSGAKVVLTAHDVQAFNYGKLVDFQDYRVSPWRQLGEQKLRYNPFRNVVIRSIFRTYVDHVVAVSGALRDALMANSIGNVEVLHNGINTQEWRIEGRRTQEFKTRYGVGEQAILFVGGSYLKGVSQILAAFVSLRGSVPHAQLLVLGRGAPRGEGLVPVGWLSGEELRAAYAAAAVVVVPSICFDSFPTINLEAMACGKPVVATRLGGSPEAVVDGHTGYVVDPYDIKTLAAKLQELLQNPAKARAMGEAGRVRVEKEFTLTRQAQMCLELFVPHE